MIKKSIVAKLFIIITILFIIQGIIQFGFQKYLLIDFYENEKIDKLELLLKNTIENFKNTNILEDQINILSDFTNETGEPIAVYDEFYEYHQASFRGLFERGLIVEDNYGNQITLVTDNLLKQEDNYLIGETLILYSFDDGEFLEPFKFIYNKEEYNLFSLEEEEFYRSISIEIIKEEVIIIDYYEFFTTESMQIKMDILDSYIFDEQFGNLDMDQFYLDSELFENTDYEYDLYEFISKEVYIDNRIYYFESMISLQPINEVINIQNKFQIYLLGIMFIVIIVAGVIISRVIVKPIIRISKSAQLIGHLNFSSRCDENRVDEIGDLGKNINYLSDELSGKINELELINTKLSKEIEFEKEQEIIRKEFVANVSHELKTPLGVIASYAEGIIDGISKESENYYLEVIIEEVKKMNDLIVDMLELTSIESGFKLENIEKISLSRLISNKLRPFEPEMERMNINIEFEECLVEVDVKKMELVFSNLITNAFRYVNDDKIINIKLFKNEKNIIFEIENSYNRVETKELEKIWSRFYRLEKSRSRELGGNGLGLSIVKSVLDLHNLKYEVSNTPVGIRFRLYF